MTADDQKQQAAEYASTLVEEGMTVGLGTGSTARFLIEALGQRVRSGLRFVGVPTSDSTARLAASLGIEITTLDRCEVIDLTIDGADEVDPSLNLIKGRGGALLREKMVAVSSHRYVIVVDAGKLVPHLFEHTPLPVEVIPFGWTMTARRLTALGLHPTLRSRRDPFRTDNGNYILDCSPAADTTIDPSAVGPEIKQQTGVVEHGLFLGLTTMVVVGTPAGIDVLQKSV